MQSTRLAPNTSALSKSVTRGWPERLITAVSGPAALRIELPHREDHERRRAGLVAGAEEREQRLAQDDHRSEDR